MRREQNPNLTILELAVRYLGPLADDMVFIGGCATGLLLTDPAAPPIRGTQDVDVITEVTSLAEYHRLSEQLRARGFVEDRSADAPVCRWKTREIILDVMPTDPAVLGFGNEWYRPALRDAGLFTLPSGARIKMVTAAYFLATKLAAFAGRGNGDYVMSHDMEDIMAVLDGRPEVVREVMESPKELKEHLRDRFRELLADDKFVNSIPGHLPGDAASQARVPTVLERIKNMANIQ